MQHHVTFRPVRIRERHALLGVDSVRVVGYRAVCSCGWRSVTRGSVRLARVEGATHRDVEAQDGAHPVGQPTTTT